ncbi:MAG: inositol monophosphatase family protein [Alphaproteobacteria bacterium]|nr:inositol monophosphatase family protein [Alphaproteobacteria bacterium]
MENLLKGSSELNQMFAALIRTATGLRRDFGEVEQLQQSLSGARDFVAKAQQRIEQMILSDLQLVRPAAGVLTPNVSTDGDGISEFVLALSGAENFIRGNEHFAISLALRVNGETRAALIYAPIDDKLFYAEKDSGTYIYSAFHSTKMRVSKLSNPSDLTIGYSALGSRLSALGTARITGCPALDLASVATGKFDAFVSEPIDYAELAAGELMVTESGGKIWEHDGQLFVTNGIVDL